VSEEENLILATSNMTMATAMIGFATAILTLVPILILPKETQSTKEALTSLSVICIFLFCFSTLFYNEAAAITNSKKAFKEAISRANTFFLIGLAFFLLEPLVLLWSLELFISMILGGALWIIFFLFVVYRKSLQASSN
jgi:glucan phosphoethanolaminetransferase (alkaline phosphatase superfamily)